MRLCRASEVTSVIFVFALILCTFAPVSGANCRANVSPNTPCTKIFGWRDFRLLLQQSEGDLVLCPFSLNTGGRQYKVVLNNKVNVICQIEGECKIHGHGRHLQFGTPLLTGGQQSEVLIQGFEFQSLSYFSVHSLGTSSNHALCNCNFIGNTFTAVKIESMSYLKIKYCTFEALANPEHMRVSAINNRGTLEISGSSFHQNNAPVGPAYSVVYSQSGSSVTFEKNDFYENKGSNLIVIDEVESFSDLGFNRAYSNDGCNGILSSNKCIPFLHFTMQPSNLPSVSIVPSFEPSVSSQPSSGPSLSMEPTKVPSISFGPSSKPSESTGPSFEPSVSLQPSSEPSLSIMPSEAPSTSARPSSKPSESTGPSTVPSVSSQPSSSSVPTTSAYPSLVESISPTTSMEPSFFPSSSIIPSEAPSDQKSTLWFQQLSTASPGTCVETPNDISGCVSIGSWDDLRNTMENAKGVLILCPFNLSKPKKSTPPIVLKEKAVIVCGTVGQCKIKGGGPYLRIQKDYEDDGAGITLQGFAFHGATVKALRVSTPDSFKAPVNTLCSCDFVGNQGNLGAAIQVEERAKLSVHSCLFRKNKANYGSAIYAYGDIYVHDTKFLLNDGMGSAIYSNSASEVLLRGNTFHRNVNGLVVIAIGSLLKDEGGNEATKNNICNGLYNALYPQWCLYFKDTPPSTVPALAPSTPSPTAGTPRGGVGYFNYDPSDNDYGPENWGDVQKTDEYNRWLELDKYHHHNLNNRCSTSTRQGPIDVCDSHAFTGTCNEFHQIRPVHGDYKLDNEHVTMQILPGRLRIKYDTRPNGPMIEKPETYTDQFKQTPQPPHADFAHYWNWHIQANHVDIKLPSEHTVCGKRFVGELTIWHLHPEPDKFQRPGQDSIVITILIDIHPQGRPNQHLQKAIEEWKKVSEKDTESCQSGRKLEEMYEGDYQLGQYADLSAHSDFLSSNIFADEMLGNEKSRDELNRQHRKAYETVEGKNQGWSPYNKEILNSLYFYAYHGSLTEPPCSEFVAWRVMHDPMYISRGQLEQLQDILFNHKNPNCERTSFDYKESVARPVKSHHVDHQFYQCTRDNYVSDKEKAYMREITGDPHWCC